MAVELVNEATLKRLKNNVIGNANAKASLAADGNLLQLVIECVNEPPVADEDQGGGPISNVRTTALRVEATQIVASLAHGSYDALGALLEFRAHQTLLFALAHLQPSDPPALCTALARAFRTLMSLIAEVVGPSDAGLLPELIACKPAAHAALDYLFEPPILDIYLPLLRSPSAPLRLGVAHALSRSLRSTAQRRAVMDWTPATERVVETRSNRGWEKPGTSSSTSASRGGGWVARQLSEWLRERDAKAQEAAMLALAALVEEVPVAAVTLSRPGPDGVSVLALVMTLIKSRSTDMQLAASSCAARIMRAHFPAMTTFAPPYPLEYRPAVVHTLNRIIGSTEPEAKRTRAAYTLHELVADDVELCRMAYEHGSMNRLTTLLTAITPLETPRPLDWDVSEPASTSALREACLTALASLAMHDNALREAFIDTTGVAAALHSALLHAAHPGCRYAACQCVRAMSRAVSVIRTSLLDSGLGTAVIALMVRSGEDGATEDRRVLWAALAGICNLVADFSPLSGELLKEPAFGRLAQLVRSPDPALRLNAFWAVKNLLWKASADVKRTVTARIGWAVLAGALTDADAGVQEQAFAVLRNVTNSVPDVGAAIAALGPPPLLDPLAAALGGECAFPAVQAQAAGLLANVANGPPSVQDALLAHARLPGILRTCIADARPAVRHPAVAAAAALVHGGDARRRRQLRELGLEAPLRALCDVAGAGARGRSASVSGDVVHGSMMGVETDREVRDKAREALHVLEHDIDLEMP